MSEATTYPSFEKINSRKRWVVLTTIFAAFLKELEFTNPAFKTDSILVGCDQNRFLSRSLFPQKEKITSVQPTGQIQLEKLLSLKPDLVLGYFIAAKDKQQLERAKKAGISVLFCQSHLEPNPLGRAEWQRVFQALAGQPNNSFSDEITRYKTIQTQYKTYPWVNTMVNLPYSGTWDIPCANSYLAQLLYDARCKAVWLENGAYQGSGSAQIGLEQGMTVLTQADVWINPGLCDSKACISQTDVRLQQALAFKQGRIIQHDAQIEPDGANVFWDMGAVHPSLVLEDLGLLAHEYGTDLHKRAHFYRILP